MGEIEVDVEVEDGQPDDNQIVSLYAAIEALQSKDRSFEIEKMSVDELQLNITKLEEDHAHLRLLCNESNKHMSEMHTKTQELAPETRN